MLQIAFLIAFILLNLSTKECRKAAFHDPRRLPVL